MAPCNLDLLLQNEAAGRLDERQGLKAKKKWSVGCFDQQNMSHERQADVSNRLTQISGQ